MKLRHSGFAAIGGVLMAAATSVAFAGPGTNESIEERVRRLEQKLEKQEAQAAEARKAAEAARAEAAAAKEAAAKADADSLDCKIKPGLECKAGDLKLKVGGRVMADANWVDEDNLDQENATEIRRARIEIEGEKGDTFGKVQVDFADDATSLKDVYGGVKLGPGKLKIGNHKLTSDITEHTSSKYITFLERGLPNALVNGRRLGVSYSANNDAFGGQAAVFSFDDLADDAPEGTGAGGRLWFVPINEDGRLLHFGLAGNSVANIDRLRIRQRPDVHTVEAINGTMGGDFDDLVMANGMLNAAAVAALNTGGRVTFFDADDADYDQYIAEVAGLYGPFHASAQFLSASAEGAGRGGLAGLQLDNDLTGYNVEAGYFLTGETRPYKMSSGAWDKVKPKADSGAWEVAARYSKLENDDVDGLEMEDVTLGVNWYLNANFRFMLNYIMADTLDGRDEPDYLTFRTQFIF